MRQTEVLLLVTLEKLTSWACVLISAVGFTAPPEALRITWVSM